MDFGGLSPGGFPKALAAPISTFAGWSFEMLSRLQLERCLAAVVLLVVAAAVAIPDQAGPPGHAVLPASLASDERGAQDRLSMSPASSRDDANSTARTAWQAPPLHEVAADIASRWGGRRLHATRRLPRLTLPQLSKPENLRYRSGEMPFMLVGVAADDPFWEGALERRRAASESSGAGGSAKAGNPDLAHGGNGVSRSARKSSLGRRGFGEAGRGAALPMWDSPFAQQASDPSSLVWAGAPKDPATVSARQRRRLASSTTDGTGLATPASDFARAPRAGTIASDVAAPDNATSSTWTAVALNQAFGRRAADAYPHNMHEVDVHPVMTTMVEALAELDAPSGKFRRSALRPDAAYVQWNVPSADWPRLTASLPGPLPHQFAADDAWLDACLGSVSPLTHRRGAWPPRLRLRSGTPHAFAEEFSRASHWRMLLTGSRGAGMFGHWDVLATASWQFQVSGAKRWHICAPDQRPNLGDAAEFDGFFPNYTAVERAKGLSCFLDVVLPGEFIFYPRNFWHQTENLATPSTSISSTVVDALNHRTVANEMKRECLGLNRLMVPSPALCRALDRCFEWWQSAYHGNMLGPGATDAGRWPLPAEVAEGQSPDKRLQAMPLLPSEQAGGTSAGRPAETGSATSDYRQRWERRASGAEPGGPRCPLRRALFRDV